MIVGKVVVLGSGGVGKSALTVQFVKGMFITKYDPTIEDSYRIQVESLNKQIVLLEILDTAGTEQFNVMRELYMKNGQGFACVYSITSQATFNELDDIRDTIIRVKESQDVPIVLVANKCDLEEERVVTRETGEGLAKKWACPYFETSAKTRHQVPDVFLHLAAEFVKSAATVKREKKCTLL